MATPGPWWLEKAWTGVFRIVGPAGKPVAYLSEFEADDAALIVAAPKLLAALRLAAVWTAAMPSDPPEKIAADNAVQAAIRLAEVQPS